MTAERDAPTEERDDFLAAADALITRAAVMRRTAITVGLAGAVLVCVAATYGWISTRHGAELLVESNYNTQMLVFELARITAGAALLGAFAWGVLNLSRAALDQATRYEKRLIAGHFLVYVLRKFEKQIKNGDIDLRDVMSVFKAWSDSVDSAFTHVKFGSKSNQALAATIGKDGVAFATGGADLPKSPTAEKSTS